MPPRPLTERQIQMAKVKKRMELKLKAEEVICKAGDFDHHYARIMKIRLSTEAEREVGFFRKFRPDIAKFKFAMLELELQVKFNQKKTSAWVKLRSLLLPKPHQRRGRKQNEPSHSEVCSHLFHVICIGVMGRDVIMQRMREFVRCFTDEELSKFLHDAVAAARDHVPRYFVGMMLLRPDLIQLQKDHIIEQMRGSPVKYRGFERIARLMGGLKFFFYTADQTDVLAECFVRELEDMYILNYRDWKRLNFDDFSGGVICRNHEATMFADTFNFFKEYAVKRGFCGEAISSVSDLVCVIPTDVNHHPIRRILTYALLYHRRMIPDMEKRNIIGIWMDEFVHGKDLSEDIPARKDVNFNYHNCFVSLVRFISKFDMKLEGFRNAVGQAGGDKMMRIIIYSLFYDGQYERALEFVDLFMKGRSYSEMPVFHFIRMQILVRLKRFDEATEIALTALIHAKRMGWLSENTSRFYADKRRIVTRQDDEWYEEDPTGKDNFLEDDDDDEVKMTRFTTIHLIRERDTAYYLIHLLLNLLRTNWNNDEKYTDSLHTVFIIMSHIDYHHGGSQLFEEVIKEVAERKKLEAPRLLFSLQSRYMIVRLQEIALENPDEFVLCKVESEKADETEEGRAEHKKRVERAYHQAFRTCKDKFFDVIPLIVKTITLHASALYAGVTGKDTFVLEESDREKEGEDPELEAEEIVTVESRKRKLEREEEEDGKKERLDSLSDKEDLDDIDMEHEIPKTYYDIKDGIFIARWVDDV